MVEITAELVIGSRFWEGRVGKKLVGLFDCVVLDDR
jgi:hypothetical protein